MHKIRKKIQDNGTLKRNRYNLTGEGIYIGHMSIHTKDNHLNNDLGIIYINETKSQIESILSIKN